MGFAGGDLTLQTSHEEFLMCPRLGTGPLSQTSHRLAHRGGFQGAGQEGDLSGQVAVGR